MTNSEITVYLGDVHFFEEHVEQIDGASSDIVEVIRQIEVLNNVTTHVAQGQTIEIPDPPHFENILVASADFATLSDSSVSNFLGLLNRCIWRSVHIHNPPARVIHQLKGLSDVKVLRQKPFVLSKQGLVDLNVSLHAQLIGQGKAIESILSGLYSMTKADRNRPVVLMFYGPSGVGKTQAAQIIGNAISGGLLRKQFSMLHSEHFFSYIFGGNHSDASFARDLAERDAEVILLDEFDKCNPVFYSAFYELFDEGSFRDRNYEIELKSGVIICTANFQTLDEIKSGLGDPIYSRFDRFIKFDHLNKQQIVEVVDRIISDAYQKLSVAEREVVDGAQVRTKLSTSDWGTGNIRQLKHYVDEVFELALVRDLLINS
ncbi:AAA family ATPase [Corynebacterium epidermidicanis]|uniref:ATPase family protein associated with various cellular activities (AAA) n=1 Tax=Corynebacterium epidermidicanis TaxID=1050174 RepID=A0A0G3GSX7_9CORY|nr:AAA family ATPase [Corynebacterium epidermidicanis]AKK04286.1 ATPase family protein associated with various cellular activities (AAA) [Corynebacterium epidermidicanis]